MNTLTTTRSPSFCQLRLAAVNCRKYPSPSVSLWMRVHRLGFQFRCVSSSRGNGNGNVSERRTNSKFSIEAFSGWNSDESGNEVLDESPPKKNWSGGIVGGAVAGVILFAGLTFATLSISKRASGPKQNMEPLTTLQEESLASVDQNNNVKDNGTDEDSYPHEKENEATAEDNISVQQDFQEELPVDEVQSDPPELHKSDVHDELVDESSIQTSDAEKLESSNILEEDTTDDNIIVSLVSDTATNESLSSILDTQSEQAALDVILEPQLAHKEGIEPISPRNEDFENQEMQGLSGEESELFSERKVLEGGSSPSPIPESALPFSFASEQTDIDYNGNISTSIFDSVDLGKLLSSASIPAPSVVSPALQVLPGKVLVPAVVDQVQGQALAALQVLKVIEGDVQPGDLCTRREYARWLVSASSALSRNTLSKVYPAMFIENVTELAFDDITPEDPDFSSIQGLAEAGLIASKLSKRDMNISDQDEGSQYFCPESPLSRQDLVSWKMSLEKRLLPVADKMILQKLSGFIDIDKINPDAWPSLIADLSAGEQGIIGLAFGYTRLFQADKPVTKAQAAIALATGEASNIVSEELARIEAESMAEKAVAAHSALVDQVEKDVNTYFEKDLLLEREKIVFFEKLAEETKQELEQLKAERKEENIKMIKERAAVDAQMEVFSRLRHQAEEELQSIMSSKVEVSYEKERLNKLRIDAEMENQEISRLQYELEVERKALAMARSWAEDEAKRAREQAKAVEAARDRWESQGIKVIVDNDLREDAIAIAESSWLNNNQLSIEGTKNRAENLIEKLKSMAADLKGKSKQTIDKVIEKILFIISQLKEFASKAGKRVSGSMQDLTQRSVGLGSAVKESAKRVAGDCREGVEKLTHKFKT